jgi:hypothetical protein
VGELLGTERERSAFAPSLSPASRLIGNAWVILTLGTLVSAARRAAAGSRHPWPKSGTGRRSAEACSARGSYHLSQQHTFTGRLTSAMPDAMLHLAHPLTEEAG